MIEFFKNYYWLLIILLCLILLLIFILIHKKNRQKDKVIINNEYLNLVSDALGGFKNIVKTEIEHKRLRVFLHDTKLLDANKLNSLKIPASIKGNEIKLLLKEEPDLVKKYIDNKGETK